MRGEAPEGLGSGLRMPAARKAFVALLAGAVCISFAPIFVRLSEIEPTATAFQRMLLAIPLFLALSTRESKAESPSVASKTGSTPQARASGSGRSLLPVVVLAGLFFAGDLAFWHWSLSYTSVANSTLLVNLSPILVTVIAWGFMGERITIGFLAGMAVALGGAVVLVGTSFGFEGHVFGDVLAVVTAFFYAGYVLTVKGLRAYVPVATLLARTSGVAAAALLLISLLAGEDLIPGSARGWLVVLGLAWVSQFAGQGLIVTALRYLPASLSSVSLLLQPVSAAVLAWIILSEPVGAVQGAGGVLVLAGIWLARRSSPG